MGKTSYDEEKLFKVSLSGYDVATATSEQCAVHSGFTYEMVKEDLEGYVDYTSPSVLSANTSYTISTISHGLGYIPEFHVFAQNTGEGYFAELPMGFLSTGVKYEVKIDDSNLIILLVNGNDSDWEDTFTDTPYRFRYQILINQLNTDD